MKANVELSEIREKTPFNHELMGRTIPTGFIYDPEYENENIPEFTDEEDWLNFVPKNDGEIQFYIGEPIEGIYFGKEAADPENDVNIQFLELYCQRISWPDIVGLFPSLTDDLRNLCACLSKLSLYQSQESEGPTSISRMVQTELEYLFFVSRSLYDGLQFIISNTWDKLHSTTEESDWSADLPSRSFKDMALDGDEPIDADTLVEKYGIPEALADFYSAEAPTFKKIRNFRDSIVHQGDSLEHIFVLEEGLAVDTESDPYSDFSPWEDEHMLENDLAPIWPFAAYIVDHTISSLQRFLEGLLEDPIVMPPALAEGYNVYIRGPHIRNLNELESLSSSDPWAKDFRNSNQDQA